jgi:hypothetical protein
VTFVGGVYVLILGSAVRASKELTCIKRMVSRSPNSYRLRHKTQAGT